MDIRVLEKTDKWGYMFYIKYDGTKFHSFDEMKDKKSVKGRFGEILKTLGFSWAKGIQQGGRTDAKVSASENILYMSSKFLGDLEELKERFNEISQSEIVITRINRTVPNLDFPQVVERREYIYNYPKKLIKIEDAEVEKRAEEVSGHYDVSRFTTKKGQNLCEHIREVEVSFKNGKLFFSGNSFMPQQVRMMSGYILTGEIQPLPGRYLTLSKIVLKEEIKENIFEEVSDIELENVCKVYENRKKDTYIFYVEKGKKSEFIGKNGKNIKSLKKIYGNVVAREIL